jgi:hypothetical protein
VLLETLLGGNALRFARPGCPNPKSWSSLGRIEFFKQSLCRGYCTLAPFVNDLVDQAVLLGLLSRHNEVAFHVLLDSLHRLTTVVSQEPVDHRPHPQNLLRVDVNIGCLARKLRHRRLMNDDARVSREKRFVGAPAVSSKAAIEAASPTQVVTTSGRTYCIVS